MLGERWLSLPCPIYGWISRQLCVKQQLQAKWDTAVERERGGQLEELASQLGIQDVCTRSVSRHLWWYISPTK